MDTTQFEQQLLDFARVLLLEEREQLLDSACQLMGHRLRGISGKELIERTKDIQFSKEDLERMAQAIEEIDMYDYWEAKSKPVKPAFLNVVALRRDLDEYKLQRGQVGTVVELLDDGVFEVEFADNQGRTYATLALKASQLMVLHYEPVA